MGNHLARVHAAQSELFEQLGAFFCFNQETFAAKKVPDEQYRHMGAGLVCPARNATALVEGLERITREGVCEDTSINPIKDIVIRELDNYECFYTGNIEDCVAALVNYDVSEEDILSIFKEEQERRQNSK